MEHKLPENHNCRSAPPRKPLGSWQTKKAYFHDQQKRKAEKEKFLSIGEFHFVKKTLPLFDPKKKKKKKSKLSFLRRKKKGQ